MKLEDATAFLADYFRHVDKSDKEEVLRQIGVLFDRPEKSLNIAHSIESFVSSPFHMEDKKHA